MGPQEFAAQVMMYCFRVGGSVSSWGRTWWHNLAVGGAEASGHLFFLGADVRTWEHLTDAEKKAVRARLNQADFRVEVPPLAARVDVARRLGLYLYPEDDHDHLQPLTWRKG